VSEADLAAQLIERLLAEPDFRVRFRADPAAACREAGLEQLAQEMSLSTGKAMVTLDVRESRSSLAGVMMAAAMEGVGLYHFSEDVLPHLADVPAEIGDVLSRVNLPAIKGALASSPEHSEPVVLAEPPPEAPPEREEAPLPPEVEDEPKPKPEPPPKEPKTAAIDPAQFGAEGSGGKPTPEALALLSNDNVVLDETGIADLKAGRIDPRIVAVLTKLSSEHKITVSCMCSDHSKFTTGGSISNHHYGRGLDIAAVDGVPVNASNFDAREIAMELQQFDPAIRPDEIGTPWAISGNGYFTDSGHQDHLHIGFKQQINDDWTPPDGLAAQVAEPRRRGDSLVFATVGEPPGEPTANTLTFAATPREAAEEGPAPVPESATGAGPKARAAVAEAKKYLGTPYQWGGSTPETNFDCSGLVQWSYAQAGIQIPRVTYDQIAADNGKPVERDDLLPGDLVFFADAGGDVHHVGMSLGGDKFIHAPSTGDVVKISSLDESYYAGQFTGGRRFDAAGGPTAEPTQVAKAQAAVARDAAEVRRGDSLLFAAVKAQEAAKSRATMQFIQAVPSKDAAPPELAAVAGGYPGDDAPKAVLAKWLAGEAQRAGLPPELPVMAALVESGVKNLSYGHADSVGFFQMRVSYFNQGAYAGYPERPELQAKWFIDTALAVKKKRIAAGDVDFGKDPSQWGEWIADVERPAEQFRGRYQLRLDEARGLLS
jgi:cell wall-associated NlpC family hydrolase